MTHEQRIAMARIISDIMSLGSVTASTALSRCVNVDILTIGSAIFHIFAARNKKITLW